MKSTRQSTPDDFDESSNTLSVGKVTETTCNGSPHPTLTMTTHSFSFFLAYTPPSQYPQPRVPLPTPPKGLMTPSWTTPHHTSPLDEINEIRRNAADSLWVLKVTRRRILPLTANI